MARKKSNQVEPAPSVGQQMGGARFGGVVRGRRRNANAAAAAASPSSAARGNTEKAHAVGWGFRNLFGGWRSAHKAAGAPPDAAYVPATASAAQTAKIDVYFVLYYAFIGKREGDGKGGTYSVCVKERKRERALTNTVDASGGMIRRWLNLLENKQAGRPGPA